MSSPDEPVSASAAAEQAARRAVVLALRELQVAGVRERPALVRTALLAGAAGAALLAGAAALVLANWAIVRALSGPLPGWRAPLVLAAGWLALAAGLGALVWLRARPRGAGAAGEPGSARDDAEAALHESLDRLGAIVAADAERRIAAALLPIAGGLAAAGGELVDATDEVIEVADELTDVLEETVPGGMIVNRAFDVALAPGRLGIRVARTAARRGGFVR